MHRLRDSGHPFFLALGFHKPHLPFNAPKRYWDLSKPDDLPLPANPFAPAGVTPFSLTDYSELRAYFGIPKHGDIPTDLARRLIHGYAACVSYMDAQLGRVLTELKRLRLWDSTVIVLWGYHGWKLGDHNSWCKHTNFEIDTRAPLLARIPGMSAVGKATDALVEFIDIYPALCDGCGLEIPLHCEGRSFVLLLDRPALPWKEAAFSQYPRRHDVMGYAMRTDRYRCVEWQERESRRILALELYDHTLDPLENVNAAGRTDPALLARLSTQLRNALGQR